MKIPFLDDIGSMADSYSKNWYENGYLIIAAIAFIVIVIFLMVKT